MKTIGTSYLSALLTAFLCVITVVFPVHAVEVIEAEPTTVTEGGGDGNSRARSTLSRYESSSARSGAGAAAGNVSAELYVELQSLRNEVMQLRGMVEEQDYTLQQLEQRRMDDYLEFDRRIGELSGGVTPAATAPASANPQAGSQSTPPGVAGNTVSSPSSDESIGAYRSAYQLVKEKRFDSAKDAFNSFVEAYPESSYVPNAYFWLGELYYLDSNLEKSRQSFSLLVTGHPQHKKVPDAKFKLGKIYHQLGDVKTAREMLRSVVSEYAGSKAATPAKEYMENSL